LVAASTDVGEEIERDRFEGRNRGARGVVHGHPRLQRMCPRGFDVMSRGWRRGAPWGSSPAGCNLGHTRSHEACVARARPVGVRHDRRDREEARVLIPEAVTVRHPSMSTRGTRITIMIALIITFFLPKRVECGYPGATCGHAGKWRTICTTFE